MTFKPRFANSNFVMISIDEFIKKQSKDKSDTNFDTLREDLMHFKTRKENGEKCQCGNEIWIIGSAFVGKGCFTCITGESDSSKDYEIK